MQTLRVMKKKNRHPLNSYYLVMEWKKKQVFRV